MRVMKYLRGHIPSVVLIVLLLVAQSFCELSLPAYTSRIVDTGIQGGGIESATPLALTDKTMDGVRLFLSDEDAQTVSAAYTYDNGVWTLNDTAQQPELESVFIRPLVMYARLSEQGANTVLALRRQMQGGLITREEILARGEEALSGMGVLTDSVLRSAAMQFLKTEYAVAGLNVNHMRTSYLLRTGGRMLLLTLGMIAAAVLCSYVGAKMSAAIGRDLRAQVFRKVLSFSSAEMDKFSTASLITRSTNDVTQIQAVCVMLVRIVLYAPIIGLGGVVMVARTKTGLGWVIALAVAAMLLLVGVLMKIAMPQFRAMQQRVDDVNLVSREILTGLPVIRAFHRERHEQVRFDTASAALMNTQLFVNRTMAFMGPVMTLIMYGVTVMIEWFGAKSINAGHMQIGDMIAFSSYASMIIMAFMMITIVAVMLPRAEVSAARVDEILHTRASVRAPRSAEPAPTDATITFDHVSFRYPGAEDDVLHDVSFMARPGEVTAIVGSTGCGKSTLLNALTGAGIPANNRLFDTLDTTTRLLTVSDTLDVVISDTVGFIRKLPHQLVEAFKATLEELEYADLLLHVIDISDPHWLEQAQIVDELIEELGAQQIPCLRVYNKSDLYFGDIRPHGENSVNISAKTGEGVDELLARIDKLLDKGTRRVTIHLPYDKGGFLDMLYREAKVESVEYGETIDIVATCVPRVIGQVKDYIEGYQEPKEDWEE